MYENIDKGGLRGNSPDYIAMEVPPMHTSFSWCSEEYIGSLIKVLYTPSDDGVERSIEGRLLAFGSAMLTIVDEESGEITEVHTSSCQVISVSLAQEIGDWEFFSHIEIDQIRAFISENGSEPYGVLTTYYTEGQPDTLYLSGKISIEDLPCGRWRLKVTDDRFGYEHQFEETVSNFKGVFTKDERPISEEWKMSNLNPSPVVQIEHDRMERLESYRRVSYELESGKPFFMIEELYQNLLSSPDRLRALLRGLYITSSRTTDIIEEIEGDNGFGFLPLLYDPGLASRLDLFKSAIQGEVEPQSAKELVELRGRIAERLGKAEIYRTIALTEKEVAGISNGELRARGFMREVEQISPRIENFFSEVKKREFLEEITRSFPNDALSRIIAGDVLEHSYLMSFSTVRDIADSLGWWGAQRIEEKGVAPYRITANIPLIDFFPDQDLLEVHPDDRLRRPSSFLVGGVEYKTFGEGSEVFVPIAVNSADFTIEKIEIPPKWSWVSNPQTS